MIHINIPENSMPGTLNIVKDYGTISHKMQTSIQSSYFNERFGRSDFKQIDEQECRLGNALAYLMKYIEKTGERSEVTCIKTCTCHDLKKYLKKLKKLYFYLQKYNF